jgi:dihydropteroate synthase
VQNTAFSTNKTLNLNGRLMDLSTPRVMGVLNVTPDSFYDGGRFVSEKQILTQAEKMIHEGVDIIDIGGYSSRPGAADISVEEEMDRALQAIRSVLRHFSGTPLSIDTFRSVVAHAAVHEGAAMINDISGGTLDASMFNTVSQLQVPYILMHMRGTPSTMKTLTHYDDLVKELLTYFQAKVFQLAQAGVNDIVIDPGFGFAKTREQNFALLDQLETFALPGKPLMAGLSRKSMIWKTLEIKPEDGLHGTTVLNTVALLKGASLLRVHDVKEAVQAIQLIRQLTGDAATR